jgi:Lrp/AsnC family leucine-responsive transcriptional regulator
MSESFEKLDSTDAEIIKLLRQDGRMSGRAIAQALGIAEPSVASRIRSLYDSGVMRVIGLVSLAAIRRPISATVGIRTIGRSINEIAADLGGIDGVFSVMSVLGRFDMFAAVSATDLHDLRRILETRIGAVKGVESIECLLSLDIAKLSSLWAKF